MRPSRFWLFAVLVRADNRVANDEPARQSRQP